MAITETRPETADDAPPVEHVNPWDTGEEYPALAQVLGSGDHKTLGRLYIGLALVFGLVAWALQGISALDGIEGSDLVADDAAFQLYTLGKFSLVFLAGVPLLIGLATYVVPLQVGSSTIAFPRAAAAAFWTWVLGSVLLLAAYVANGGVAGGRANAVDLSLLGLAVVVLALLLATVCLLTTIVGLRTPGLSLDRVPVFSWSVFAGGSLWLLTLPVLLGNILLVYVDVHFGRPSDFGVADNQWQQLSWVFDQPQVFVYAVPALGIIADVAATRAGLRQRLRGLLLSAIGALAVLSFGAYAQPFFNDEVWTEAVYVAVGVLLFLPVLLAVSGIATTARAGRTPVDGATTGVAFTALLLLLAGLGAALYVISPLRLQESADFQDGLAVLVLGAALTGSLAGLFFWAPKIWGRFAKDGLAKLSSLAAFGGVLIAGLALCAAGFGNRWEPLADASDALHGIAAAGAALVVVAVLLAVGALLTGARDDVADDAWGTGQTLEWMTASPPPVGNFGALAEVTSPEPALDAAISPEGRGTGDEEEPA
jgi:cytochrome c oxidase subunit 1